MAEEGEYPMAARAAIEDTYMDDVISGADTVEAARQLCKQLNGMMLKGGFKLRKWASNHPTVLKDIPDDCLAIPVMEGINLDPDPMVKTLGLTWIPTTDQLRFQFDIPEWNSVHQPTKRQILSVIASLFDPLGLLGAAITTAKIIMQLLWRIRSDKDLALDWDQSPPSTVGELWKKYYQELPLLSFVSVDALLFKKQSLSKFTVSPMLQIRPMEDVSI